MVAVRYPEEITSQSEYPVALRLVSSEPRNLADDCAQIIFEKRRLWALVVLAVVSLTVIWSASVLLPGGSGGMVSSSAQIELESTHVVLPGETLWEIMRDRDPSGDIRADVAQVSEQLGGSVLQVGQIIRFSSDDEVSAGE